MICVHGFDRIPRDDIHQSVGVSLEVLLYRFVRKLDHRHYVGKLLVVVPYIDWQRIAYFGFVHNAPARISDVAFEQSINRSVEAIEICLTDKTEFLGMILLAEEMNGLTLPAKRFGYRASP
jgi:hypothetical protein